MAGNTEVEKHWQAYVNARDRGHLKFVAIADRCEKYFVGDHWEQAVKAKLNGRPALTVNMVLATLSTAFGQLLENFAEVSFYSKSQEHDGVGKVLNQVFKGLYADTGLRWKDMEMAMDGFITGRGFLDARVGFSENLRGDIEITQLNPKDVLIDPEASTYDPKGWKEVFISKWLTLDEIQLLYGNASANKLRHRSVEHYAGSFDKVVLSDIPGVFAGEDARSFTSIPENVSDSTIPHRFRVVERQWKKLDVRSYFVDVGSGETRPVPDTWDDERIQRVVDSSYEANAPLTVIKRLGERIRLTVFVADEFLHDDWSPYEYFTVIPYFPYFRRGRTMGVAENLIDLNDAVNKTLSQTLHIVNTTANSGWIVQKGNLVNMTMQELQDRGAETGLILEVSKMEGIKKIDPNSIPTGLDKITNQVSEWVKYVSGVSDSMRGFDRADQAAKATQAKQLAGAISLSVPFENLVRTRHYMAEVLLNLVQHFYTEPRLIRVAPDIPGAVSEQVAVNQPTAWGRVSNDLTVGEFSIQISHVPPHERRMSTQFERGMEMLKSGVGLPDWVLIKAAGLKDADKIIEDMEAAKEAQQPLQQLEMQAQQADIAQKQAETQNKASQAQLLSARVQEVLSNLQRPSPDKANNAELGLARAQLDREKVLRDDAFRNRKLAIDTINVRGQNGPNPPSE